MCVCVSAGRWWSHHGVPSVFCPEEHKWFLGVHQWHVQVGHSQLCLTPRHPPPPTWAGKAIVNGSVWGGMEGGAGGAEVGEQREHQPSLLLSRSCLFDKQSIADRHRPVGVHSPLPVEMQRFWFVFLLRANWPIRRRWSASIYTQGIRKTNSWPPPLTPPLVCPPVSSMFYLLLLC